MIENITTAFFLDKRSKKKDGTHPVKLRVTKKRTQRFYRINYESGVPVSMVREDFEKVMSARPRGKYKEIKIELEAIELKAREIIKSISPFNFDEFKKRLYRTEEETSDVFWWYDQEIAKMGKEKKLGNRDLYSSSKKSISNVMNVKRLTFESVTPEFLKRYEKKMIKLGKSENTISMYLRTMRKLFNLAIEEGATNNYPFSKNKYRVLPVKQNAEKALSVDEMELLWNYEPTPMSWEDFSKGMFLFSYLCNGINPTDIFRLKYSDIKNNEVKIIRKKTKGRRTATSKNIQFKITPLVQAIIDKWGKDKEYVFGIISDSMSIETKRSKIKTANKNINKHLKNIAEKIGVNTNISMVYARHTFATVMIEVGVSQRLISDALGHSSPKVLDKHYVASTTDAFEKNKHHLTPWIKSNLKVV